MIRVLAALLAAVLLTGIGPFRFGEQAARKHLEDAQVLIKEDNLDEAIPMLRSLRLRYPGTDATYEGTALLGVLLLEQGQPQEALMAAQGVLGNQDVPAKATNTAALVAGLSNFELKQYGKAAQHLEPLYNKVYTRGDVLRMSQAMVEIYRSQGKPYDQARWQSRLVSVVSHEEGLALSEELERIILEELTPDELLSLGSNIGAAYPADYVQFAAAKSQFRAGQFDESVAALEDFLANYPGHELGPQAILLKERAARHDAMIPTRIGVLLPLSGRFSAPGEAFRRGMDLAVQDLEDLSWTSQDIQLVYRDTQKKGADIATILHDLVLKENVVAIIGPLLSTEAEAAAEAAQALEVPLLTLTQKHGIPEMGDFVFRTYPSSEQQLGQLAQYAKDNMGVKRVGILYPDTRYGTWTAQQFWDDADDTGLNVTAVEMYQPSLENYVPVARKLSGKFYSEPRQHEYRAIRQAKKNDDNPSNDKDDIELPPIVDFDALFVADHYKSLVLLAPALAYVEIPVGRFKTGKSQKPVRLLGGNTWNHPDMGRLGGEYVVGSVFVSEYFKQSQLPESKAFLKLYKETYQAGPDTFAAHGYDTVGVVHAVLSPEKPFSRLDVQNGLMNVQYDGVTGHYAFDEVGELAKDSFILTVTRKGNIIQLFPEIPEPTKAQ